MLTRRNLVTGAARMSLSSLSLQGELAMYRQAANPDLPKPPALEYCCTLFVEIGPPADLGETLKGHRRIVPISGGHFSGPKMEGDILTGGADWQIIHSDGVVEIDSRYTLKAKDGSLIYIRNPGLRYATPEVTKRMAGGELVKPSEYYFRTNPIFETSTPNLQWLVRSFFVGIAQRRPRDVSVEVWRVG